MGDTEPSSLPAATNQWARWNTIQVVVVPLLACAIGTALGIIGSPNANEAFLIFLICLVGSVPFAIGYAISMMWRRKLHPVLFFFVGLGMSVASVAVLAALAFGACAAMGATR